MAQSLFGYHHWYLCITPPLHHPSANPAFWGAFDSPGQNLSSFRLYSAQASAMPGPVIKRLRVHPVLMVCFSLPRLISASAMEGVTLGTGSRECAVSRRSFQQGTPWFDFERAQRASSGKLNRRTEWWCSQLRVEPVLHSLSALCCTKPGTPKLEWDLSA